MSTAGGRRFINKLIDGLRKYQASLIEELTITIDLP
jgi:hypothetical protein